MRSAMETVKELIGHEDLTMTLRYSHLAPSHKTKAVNILDRALSETPPFRHASESGCAKVLKGLARPG